MSYNKASLKLNHTALIALNWWLRYIMALENDEKNYYVDLMLLTLGDLWKTKVHPKTAIIAKETKMKLNEQQALALSISFMEYDYFDAPTSYQGHLYMIYQTLPKLRYDQQRRFVPPLLYENSNDG